MFRLLLSIWFKLAIDLISKGCLLFPLTLYGAQKSTDFIGYAYNLNNEQLLYTEHHNYLSRYEHQVIYREANGKIFATKNLNYSQSYLSPDFVQENLRNGEKITSEKIDQEVEVKYKQNTISGIKKRRLNFTPNLVIDAGFDHFINQHWQSLIQGQEMKIDYLIPARTEYYQLTVEYIDCEGKGSNPKKKENPMPSHYCFSVSATNFFIALFSSELKLSYEVSDEGIRLSSFQGRSNICDKDGSYQDVKIFYHYPDTPNSLSRI